MINFPVHLKRRGIVLKIFVITTILLMLASFIIYFALYFLLPGFYKDYKISSLQSELAQFVDEAEGESIKNFLGEPLQDFENKNNVDFFDRVRDFQIENNVYFLVETPAGNSVGTAPLEYVESENFNTDIIIELDDNLFIVSYLDNFQNIDIEESINTSISEQPITLNEGEFILKVVQTLQPVDEVPKVILRFFPYLIVVILFISIIGALFYAKILSRPLLELNSVAKKMTNLDFSQKSEYKSKDELGELAESLNNMSSNLQSTMNELYNANEKLKEDIEHERKVEAERKDLFATISHELKSPITVVKGQLEGMIHHIGVYTDRDTYLQRSHKNMEQLEFLVREILHLSRIDQEGFNPKVRKINPSKLLTEITDSLEFFSSQKQLDVTVEVDRDLWINTDEKLVEKALRNIIHNAMMYSPNKAEIQVSCKDEKDAIYMTIFNSGISIEEAQLDTIFEPFKRLEKSRNRHTGGSGLGLYIVKRIFDVLHIQYKLTNERDGVLFTVRIPKKLRS